jgi:HEPN domain-containing protein
MNPLTQEWVDKAESDFRTATREIQVTQDPSYDGVCFHAQQCVEKYLKGYLQEISIAFPKTQDLVVLLDLSVPTEPPVEPISIVVTAIEFSCGRNSLSRTIG